MVQRSFLTAAAASFMAFLLVCVYVPNLFRAIAALPAPTIGSDRRPHSQLLKSVPEKTMVTVTSTVAKANATNVALETERKKKGKLRNGVPDTNRTILLSREIYHGPLTQRNTLNDQNKTKIVGFISGGYARIGSLWYNRLETLGYNNHYIICTDNETYNSFPQSGNDSTEQAYRTEASFIPPEPSEYATLRYGKKLRHRVLMMFAHRWVYLLEQLKLGNHILLTDVDNIFTSYYDMNELEKSEFDVYHALETKHPADVFRHQGFVFCGGMAWFRSSPRTIRYMEEMVRRCGMECDDQVLLNQILAFDLGVKWNRTGAEHMELTTHTHDTNVTINGLGNHFDRIVGIVTKGFTGYSEALGLKIKVWDRDFAFRGKADPSVCPVRNWVSMPFVTVITRAETMAAKERSFRVWDQHCPNQYTLIARGVAQKPVGRKQ